MGEARVKLFGVGMTIHIPEQLPPKLNQELKHKLSIAGKRWANKEIKAQAKDLLHILRARQDWSDGQTHNDTGRMRAHWNVGYPRSVDNSGFEVSFYNDAVSDKGYPYPAAEEFGTMYREGHHLAQNALQNDFLPSVLSRMRRRFNKEFK